MACTRLDLKGRTVRRRVALLLRSAEVTRLFFICNIALFVYVYFCFVHFCACRHCLHCLDMLCESCAKTVWVRAAPPWCLVCWGGAVLQCESLRGGLLHRLHRPHRCLQPSFLPSVLQRVCGPSAVSALCLHCGCAVSALLSGVPSVLLRAGSRFAPDLASTAAS